MQIPATVPSSVVFPATIEFDNVEVSYLNEDLRPPFILNSVTGAEFNNVKGQHASGVPTVVYQAQRGASQSLQEQRSNVGLVLRATDQFERVGHFLVSVRLLNRMEFVGERP
jgi:hypothetical protein